MNGRGTTGVNGVAGPRHCQTFWRSEYSASRLLAAALSSGIVDSGKGGSYVQSLKQGGAEANLAGVPHVTDSSRNVCLRM